MADCEICGKPNANKKAEIEGSTITVCEDCAKLGKVKSTSSRQKSKPSRSKKQKERKIPESNRELKRNYPNIVKDAREGMELKREDLGRKIDIKESVIAKIERDEIRPSLEMAKKLEKKLNIELVTEVEEVDEGKSKEDSKSLTIGDVADIK